jgi:hypothetical protein
VTDPEPEQLDDVPDEMELALLVMAGGDLIRILETLKERDENE